MQKVTKFTSNSAQTGRETFVYNFYSHTSKEEADQLYNHEPEQTQCLVESSHDQS